MPLQHSRGVIPWEAADTVGTTYVISGLPFTPQGFKFWWFGQSRPDNGIDPYFVDADMDVRRGGGFAVSPSSRACVAGFSQAAAAANTTGTIARTDAIACGVTAAGASAGRLDLDSIQADGFTAIVDEQPPADTLVMWEAWGGLSVAQVGTILEPATDETYMDIAVTGFDHNPKNDQVVLFFGCQSSAAFNVGQNIGGGIMHGWTTGYRPDPANFRSENITASSTQQVDADPTNNCHYNSNDMCIGMVARAAGSINGRARLYTWLNDAFKLHWPLRGTTNRKYIYLAMKGGNWKAGAGTIDLETLNATMTVSGLPFRPIGMDFIGCHNNDSVIDGDQPHDQICIGVYNTVQQHRMCQASYEPDNVATTASRLLTSYDYALAWPHTAADLDGAIDVDAINDDGFRMIVDDASGGTSNVLFVGYLAFGNTPENLMGGGSQ